MSARAPGIYQGVCCTPSADRVDSIHAIPTVQRCFNGLLSPPFYYPSTFFFHFFFFSALLQTPNCLFFFKLRAPFHTNCLGTWLWRSHSHSVLLQTGPGNTAISYITPDILPIFLEIRLRKSDSSSQAVWQGWPLKIRTWEEDFCGSSWFCMSGGFKQWNRKEGKTTMWTVKNMWMEKKKSANSRIIASMTPMKLQLKPVIDVARNCRGCVTKISETSKMGQLTSGYPTSHSCPRNF